MIYYVHLIAMINGEAVDVATDVEADNGANAVVRVLQTLDNPDGTITRLSITCKPDPEGKQ